MVILAIKSINIYEKIIRDPAKYKQQLWEIWAVLVSPMLPLYTPYDMDLGRSPPKLSKNDSFFSSEIAPSNCWSQFL